MSMTPTEAAEQTAEDAKEEFGEPDAITQSEGTVMVDLTQYTAYSAVTRNLVGYADTTAEVHNLDFGYSVLKGHEATGDTDGHILKVTYTKPSEDGQ